MTTGSSTKLYKIYLKFLPIQTIHVQTAARRVKALSSPRAKQALLYIGLCCTTFGSFTYEKNRI